MNTIKLKQKNRNRYLKHLSDCFSLIKERKTVKILTFSIEFYGYSFTDGESMLGEGDESEGGGGSGVDYYNNKTGSPKQK